MLGMWPELMTAAAWLYLPMGLSPWTGKGLPAGYQTLSSGKYWSELNHHYGVHTYQYCKDTSLGCNHYHFSFHPVEKDQCTISFNLLPKDKEPHQNAPMNVLLIPEGLRQGSPQSREKKHKFLQIIVGDFRKCWTLPWLPNNRMSETETTQVYLIIPVFNSLAFSC